MILKGYFVTHNTSKGVEKIKDRIREVGIDYYKRHKLYPLYNISIENQNGIFICTDEISEVFNLLAFSFSGLVDDEDKITEIERYGKYRCIITFYNNLTIEDIFVKEFDF